MRKSMTLLSASSLFAALLVSHAPVSSGADGFKTKTYSGTTVSESEWYSKPFLMPAGQYQVTADVTNNVVLDAGAEVGCDYVIDWQNTKTGAWNRFFEIHSASKPRYVTRTFITAADTQYGGKVSLWIRSAGRGVRGYLNEGNPCNWRVTIKKVA